MPNINLQPDLIIALSKDRVSIDLSGNSSLGRSGWKTSFTVDNIFLEEQIAQSLDLVLLENPALMDSFSCVEIVVLDRPNFCVSRLYADQGKLGEVASKYLRMRVGDTLTSDMSDNNNLICYSIPTETLMMLKEYYANLDCHHVSSILWHHFSTQQARPETDVIRLYFTLIGDTLITLAEKNGKLIFSRNFLIKDKGDLYYYSIACSRMLKAIEHWSVMIEDQPGKFEWPGDTILKIHHQLSLSSLPTLLSQYKPCGS